MLEATWNIAIREMFNLDRTTHRYLIEPISEMTHIKWSLIKRFVNFVRTIKLSPKRQLKNLLMVSKRDARSTTGRNNRDQQQGSTTGRNNRDQQQGETTGINNREGETREKQQTHHEAIRWETYGNNKN